MKQPLHRILKGLVVISLVTSLIGCTTLPSPQELADENGHKETFLFGDDNCARYRFQNHKTIICYDKDGHFTELRQRMSQAQIQEWEEANKENRTEMIGKIVAGTLIVAGVAALVVLAAAGGGGSPSSNQGCCSWHGGVAGCHNGRIVCNDGNYSPGCTCP